MKIEIETEGASIDELKAAVIVLFALLSIRDKDAAVAAERERIQQTVQQSKTDSVLGEAAKRVGVNYT